MIKDIIEYVVKTKEGFWVTGVKKRVMPKWGELLPAKYDGWVIVYKDRIELIKWKRKTMTLWTERKIKTKRDYRVLK